MATPVAGSATAATSFSVRFREPFGDVSSSVCQDGLASASEQPEPVPFHTVSVQPLGTPVSWVRVVPPTEVTNWEDDGQVVP